MLSHNERRQAKYFSVGQVNVDQVQPGPLLSVADGHKTETESAGGARRGAGSFEDAAAASVSSCFKVLLGAPWRAGRRGQNLPALVTAHDPPEPARSRVCPLF